jgi:two-component system response regulator
VEDNPNDVKLTLRAFERGKVANHIHVVKNGAEALDFLFRQGSYEGRPNQPPKVVLLDLNLPLVSGLEVLAKVKADAATQEIPIAVLTSSAEDRDLDECYKLGANSYIVKPVGTNEFFEAMRQLGFYWLALNRAKAT